MVISFLALRGSSAERVRCLLQGSCYLVLEEVVLAIEEPDVEPHLYGKRVSERS